MLRTEFRFPLDRPWRRALAFLLGEAFMGFLAIVAAALTLFGMTFPLQPATTAALDVLQWGLIGWFAFEYVFALASAPAKRRFLLSPWRCVDLATILLPLLALLPSASRLLLSSPVLRLIRLARLVTLGVRVSGVAIRQRATSREETASTGPAQVTQVADAPEFSPRPAHWDELMAWLKSPGEEWYHVANPSRDELREIAAAAGLPAGFLETHLLGTSYPHLAPARNYMGLFVWLPVLQTPNRVERQGVLFMASPRSLFSLARASAKTVERIVAPTADAEAEKEPFAARMIVAVLENVIRQNESLADTFERGLRGLEEVPVRESSAAFFERAFQLKKELSALQADLWRLKGVLARIAAGEGGWGGEGESTGDAFKRLAAQADYLYDTAINLREETLSVIELHLNIVSFDMNRVMRVLAVVSVLGLIPAVVGGLFGMNLADNPWPFTLPQVAFAVSLGMVLCLYFFFVKGWLR